MKTSYPGIKKKKKFFTRRILKRQVPHITVGDDPTHHRLRQGETGLHRRGA
jgi:hypothetical protein